MNHRCISSRRAAFFMLLLSLLSLTAWCIAEDRKINDDTGAVTQKNPAMAASYNGYGIACWEDYRNGNADIYGQVFNQKGQLVGANFMLNDAPGSGVQVRPAVAVNSRGQFVVVWEDSGDGGDVVLYARWFAANMKPLGDRVRINSVDARGRLHAAVAMDYNGNAVVCWADGRERETLEIYMQRYDHQGRPIGGNRRVNDAISGIQQFPAVAMNAHGEFVITWTDGRTAPGYGIYGQRFSAFGTPLGTNRLLSPGSEQYNAPAIPSVALQKNGDFMTAWHYGSPPQVYGCFISNADSTANKTFCLDNAGGGATFIAGLNPCVYPRLENGFVISFAASPSFAGSHVYTQSFDPQGNPEVDPIQCSESAGSKGLNCLVIGWQGLFTVIWEQTTGTDKDIYGQCRGAQIPMNVTAGTQFNSRVPISWDPPFGMESAKKYSIHRSTDMNGPFSPLASINLTDRGAAGALMRDYLDAAITPGTTYYYRVTCDETGADGPSQIVKATPMPGSQSHTLHSAWTDRAPTIDGVIKEAEWNDARKINIAVPCSDHPVELYVKNNGTKLFIAADDPLDTIIDPVNQLCMLSDLDYNHLWPAGPSSNEGLLYINSTGARFIGYYGTYPDHLGANGAALAANVTSLITTNSGHVQYEAAITIAHTAGQEIGFAAWVQDPGSIYAMHYGWAGEWPYGHLWECASALGKLIFAGPQAAPGKYIVSNTNDSGPGSLRQAMEDADSHAGPDSVLFNIPASDPNYDAASGVWTIKPVSVLRLTNQATVVDGTSQARFIGTDTNPLGPEIAIDGSESPNPYGITISGSHNHVKGLCVYSFTQTLFSISDDSNRVTGCYVGTDATGMRRMDKQGYGITVMYCGFNIIGGMGRDRNVISGLQANGIFLGPGANDNQVVGNYIGINSAGSDTIKNANGILISATSSHNTLGPGNVVSGNKNYGIILVSATCDSNRVIGNFIGTDANGVVALGNGAHGIYIEEAGFNVIGGDEAHERNIISGNNANGVYIVRGSAQGNVIQGNYIGVNASGNATLPNGTHGIYLIHGADHTQIGGENPGEGNTISGNVGEGIMLESSNANQVRGNFIGTDSAGELDLGNGGNGLFFYGTSCNNIIGSNNVIAYNQQNGIMVQSGNADYNQITQNRIYQNAGGGIRLGSGANQDVPAPHLTEMNPLRGESFPYATVEIYATSGSQADTYEGTTIAGSDGRFSWNGSVSGHFVTATATDAAYNTSALSQPLETAIAEKPITQPLAFKLEQNYPNPFNPSTQIRFCVQERCRVQLTLYDLMGRQIATLADQLYAPGWHVKSVALSAYASGVYFYRIRMKDFNECKKMILVK